MDPLNDYTISVLRASDCIESEQNNLATGFNLLLDTLESINSSQYNTLNNYSDCYDGNRAYDGPEKIFTFEYNLSDGEFFDASFNASLPLTLKAEGPVGCFIFRDLCERDCIASFETDENGSLVEGELILPQNGIYYLVVDSDILGKDIPFEINWGDLFEPGDIPCNLPSSDEFAHTITIPNFNIPIEETDNVKLWIGFNQDRSGVNYEETFIVPNEAGSIPDFGLLFEPASELTETKKCGWEEEEELIFRLEKNNQELLLEVTFADIEETEDIAAVTASNKFRKRGISKITDMKVITPTITTSPSIQVHPPVYNKDSAPYSRSIPVRTHYAWTIKNNTSDWIKVDRTEGRPNQRFRFSIDENLMAENRKDSFLVEVFNEETKVRKGQYVVIEQKANVCAKKFKDANITITTTDASCSDINDGQAIISSEDPTLFFEWIVGLDTIKHDRIRNIGVGEYPVLIKDSENCVPKKSLLSII